MRVHAWRLSQIVIISPRSHVILDLCWGWVLLLAGLSALRRDAIYNLKEI